MPTPQRILLCLLFWLCTCGAFAQTPVPAAKPDFKLFFEKAYLHTDRAVYALGDTLWFKAYVVNAQDNIPIATSNNLHVELIGPNAKVMSAEVIRLDNGTGHGDFDLTDTLPSGNYRLRAYTNWMRNFGDNFVFEKAIEVVHVNPTAIPGTTVAATPAKPLKPSASTATATAANTNNTLRFFPESGSLAEGISSIVAVKAEDATGKGFKTDGSVLSSAGDTVAHFSCDTLGMGLFALLPVKGQTYHAVIGTKGKTTSVDLPTALAQGLVLQVRQTDSLVLAVVSRNDMTMPSAYRLTVKHSGVTLINQPIQLAGAQTAVRIPSVSLPDGVNALTVYDDQNKPHCERLVYIHHAGSKNISLGTDKKAYHPNEKVTVQVSGHPNTNLSVAVVDAGATSGQADDIVSYLMLGSELRGHVDKASRYFDTTNVNRYKQLDMLLLTQGWRDFVWRRLVDSGIRISYTTENGIPVAGVLKDDNTGRAIPNVNISMYASAAKGSKLQAATTGADGRFAFPGVQLYGKQDIRLAAVNDKGQKRGSFEIDHAASLNISPFPVNRQLAVIDTTMVQAVLDAKTVKRQAVTHLKEVKVKAKSNVMLRSGTVLTTWGPDQSFDITPADAHYKTLEWYILQHVKGAMQSTNVGTVTGVLFPGMDTVNHEVVTLNGGATTSKLRHTNMSPRIFVNGAELYMDEPTQAESYRQMYYPQPITKFKHIVLKHMIGTIHSTGGTAASESLLVDRYLLYLTLADDATIDNPGSLSKQIEGYYEARTFYQPINEKEAAKTGYRATVLWNPNVQTDATGHATISFYNSSTGPVKVMVQGITPAGVPVNKTADYTVK